MDGIAPEFVVTAYRKPLCRNGIRESAPHLICPTGTSHKILSSDKFCFYENIFVPLFGKSCHSSGHPASIKEGRTRRHGR
jgi:hypothetical protein